MDGMKVKRHPQPESTTVCAIQSWTHKNNILWLYLFNYFFFQLQKKYL